MAKPKYNNKISINKDWDLDKMRSEGVKFNQFVSDAANSMLKSGRASSRKMIRRIQVKKDELFTITVELNKSLGLEMSYVYTDPNSNELISISGSYKSSNEVTADINKVMDTLDDKFYQIRKKKK